MFHVAAPDLNFAPRNPLAPNRWPPIHRQVCMTLGKKWAFEPNDTYKTTKTVVQVRTPCYPLLHLLCRRAPGRIF